PNVVRRCRRTMRGGLVRAKDGLGKYGERVAATYLVDGGYELIDRNWRCDDAELKGELDIVARREGVLTFVEVKTRSSVDFGEPAEAVGPVKVKKIRELATVWLRQHPTMHSDSISFDVMTVMHTGKGAAQVTHLREAF
ncbi:MAG TPA: YraN family protein, partial [Mycobacteriales bacterium]|nr:YraN family protein [Mycobacteriales bacterium]